MINEADRCYAIELIEEACQAGARQRLSCELLGITCRTYQRWRALPRQIDQRTQVKHTPPNKLTEQECEQCLAIANSEAYANLPPCQFVPRLADEGRYVASESTFYRLLREAKQLTHRQRSRVKARAKPKELVAYQPNQIWSWDISYLATTVFGQFYYLYLIMDIFSRKIVGWSIHESESSAYATDLVQEACATENITSKQITLHSDNDAPMKGATLLATLQKLGVATSFSRPAVSNDNPYSESLFKTLKYCCFYPEKPFDSLKEARLWVIGFVGRYNVQHCHSALKFPTPQQRHMGKDKQIVQQRQSVYEQAKKQYPQRWNGRETRNWKLPEVVILNPSNQHRSSKKNQEVKTQKVA